MLLPVAGLDPSLRHWGVAEGFLDLSEGTLDVRNLFIVEPAADTRKQVRQNSKDLEIAEALAKGIWPVVQRVKAIFVEVPVGSQSARAMASYGVCVGVLGAIRAMGIPLIEVTPTEVKVAFTGDKNATKEEMIAQAVKFYPDAPFPKKGTRILNKAEHVADAIAAIHAGVQTPLFSQLMRLYQ